MVDGLWHCSDCVVDRVMQDEKARESGSRGCQNQGKWGLEGSKIKENRGLEGSCGLLGVWWTIWLEFSAKLGSKMEQNGPSWDQVGSKLRPRVAKMLPRWPA